MRSSRLGLSLAALVAVVLMAAPAAAKVRKGNRAAAFVKVTDARGKRVQLSSYRDRVVVLTFGASWCAPCKKELPALEKLARGYDEKKVVFLAVNIDTDLAKGKKFVAEVGLKKVHDLYDPKHSTVESYDPPKMPSIYIIKRGVVRHVHGGYASGDVGKIKKLIDATL